MRKPEPEEGHWAGCCGAPECAASGEDATFKVQIVGGIVYLHCAKCGSIRMVEQHNKLCLSGTLER